ncbi:hypothetical protein [Larkinella sp. C7]|jgi:hypothetical protein|uniref:hypothetical protein n=1 Tax=Larkinella sp. C7 TaxID=2576607 RepID=UPI0011111F4B|nr:hypothetical protein [Larkinella sp. C7]
MAIDTNAIKAMIDAGIISAPPARVNNVATVRAFLKAFVDLLAAQDYTPSHNWNGTQLRFTLPNGVNGAYVDLRGATGAQGPKGDPGTLTNSAIPARTTPINQPLDKIVVQRADGVLEKVTLYQLAGGTPLVTGNLVANGNGEFGDTSNMLPDNPAKLSFDPTQISLAGGKGAFRWTGAQGSLLTVDKIAVNLLRRLRISVVARTGDANGANYDANARTYFGLQCLDADGLSIAPHNFAKVSGAALTTLATALNPGDTTLTLTSAAGWYNGSNAASRGFAWYPYVNAQGQVFPDYGYSRNNTFDKGLSGGAWAAGGIAGNVITLSVPWAGPALAAGTKIANVFSGGTFMYSSVLNNAHVPNTWTSYEAYVQGVNPGSTEDGSNLMFRPGTAFIKPLLLINYNNPALTTTFYFMMLDVRESGFDLATLLAGANTYSGNNTFSGANSFSGETSIKRLIASGSAPSIAANAVNSTGAGAGATASIGAGSTDLAGTLTIVTGTTPGTNVIFATLTFAQAMAAAPKAVILTARNNQTGMSIGRFFVGTKSTTGFTLNATDSGPAANTTFQFDYIVIA